MAAIARDNRDSHMASNIIPFSSARTARHPARGRPRAPQDQRSHPRIESDDRVFAQVVLSGDKPDMVGTTLSCTAVNLSAGGVQFRTSAAVPVGALLDIWVDVATRPGKFFLAGEVRWSRPAGEWDDNGAERWFVGVQLKSGAATDILDWRDFHAAVEVR
jgi:Tfp pilus assembly protein PilZ